MVAAWGGGCGDDAISQDKGVMGKDEMWVSTKPSVGHSIQVFCIMEQYSCSYISFSSALPGKEAHPLPSILREELGIGWLSPDCTMLC